MAYIFYDVKFICTYFSSLPLDESKKTFSMIDREGKEERKRGTDRK
jgi:hypothetical protein